MSMTETPQFPDNGENITFDALAPETPSTGVGQGSSEGAAGLEARVLELTQKLAEQEDAWLRARAEAENVRRRAQEEVAKARKFGIEKFAGELLAVKDSLEAALARDAQTLEDLRGGVDLTLKQLMAVFEKSAIRELNPIGEKFDPNFHQAIQVVPGEQEPNTVAQVLQKGYLIAERVLRPAVVIVTQPKEV